MADKFWTIPVMVEAMKVGKPYKLLMKWITVSAVLVRGHSSSSNAVVGVAIATPEGNEFAHLGDWIVKDATGKFRLCKSDIFETTYKPVRDPGDDSG